MTKKTIADWQALAEKELKRPADSLVWNTPEGIPVKPLYTADDIAGIDHLDSLPGFAPSCADRVPPCMPGAPGRSGNMPASRRRRRAMPSTARRFCRPAGRIRRLRPCHPSRL